MELKDLKITDGEINSLNVKSAADSYNSAEVQNNKNIFDKLPERIAQKHNALIEALTENGKPVQSSDVMLVRIGASGDLQVSVDGVQWQNVADNALEKKADSDDVYTKEETDEAIAEKITAIGAGDMQKAVYDTDGDGVVDNAQKLAGKTPGQLTFGADQIITDENSDERLPETLATFASCEELNDSTRTAEELVKAYVTNMPRNTMRYVTTYSSDRNAMWLCGTYKYDGCGFALKMNYDGDYRMEMYAQDNGVWADTAIVPGMDLLWENASPGSQFNPQDISIPLMNYDKVAINFDRRNGGASFEITTIVIDKNYSGNSIAVNDITSADSIMYHTTRTFTPNWNTSKISFANGKQNGSVVDDVMIPLEIYGVK